MFISLKEPPKGINTVIFLYSSFSLCHVHSSCWSMSEYNMTLG